MAKIPYKLQGHWNLRSPCGRQPLWLFKYAQVLKKNNISYLQHIISYGLLAAAELLEKVNQQLRRTETKYLELLIVPQLRSLTVQMKQSKEVAAIIGLLHLASVRCLVNSLLYIFWQHDIVNNLLYIQTNNSDCSINKTWPSLQGLQVLNWDWICWEGYWANKTSVPTNQNFLPIFQNLQELNVSYSKVGNICLHVLGQFCKQLRYQQYLSYKSDLSLLKNRNLF